MKRRVMKTVKLNEDIPGLNTFLLMIDNKEDPSGNLLDYARVMQDRTRGIYDLIDIIDDYQMTHGMQTNISLKPRGEDVLITGPEDFVEDLVRLKLVKKGKE